MALYIVTYDLHAQGQNYRELRRLLERFEGHWHMQRSVWLVRSNASVAEIRAYLLRAIDSNDTLFIGKLSAAVGAHLDTKSLAWVQATL